MKHLEKYSFIYTGENIFPFESGEDVLVDKAEVYLSIGASTILQDIYSNKTEKLIKQMKEAVTDKHIHSWIFTAYPYFSFYDFCTLVNIDKCKKQTLKEKNKTLVDLVLCDRQKDIFLATFYEGCLDISFDFIDKCINAKQEGFNPIQIYPSFMFQIPNNKTRLYSVCRYLLYLFSMKQQQNRGKLELKCSTIAEHTSLLNIKTITSLRYSFRKHWREPIKQAFELLQSKGIVEEWAFNDENTKEGKVIYIINKEYFSQQKEYFSQQKEYFGQQEEYFGQQEDDDLPF